MKYLALLTEEEKDLLVGQTFATDSYFAPIEDINGDWRISIEEIALCTNEEFAWVKDLPILPYEPKENTTWH
jgi:hypothetical protein